MGKYLTQIERGKSFTVVRRSKPVFKIAPPLEEDDAGTWETVIDFTKINKKGIPLEKLMAKL